MQVRWETISAVAQTEAIDMWYLFPLSGVNRMLTINAEISPAWCNRLNIVFGTNEWEERFYKKSTKHTLFGEDELVEKVASFKAIEEYVIERLEKEFSGVASNPAILRNSCNSPLFLLCFAASNPKGAEVALRIAEYILRPKKDHVK